MRRYLYHYTARVLYASQLGRENHDGNYDPQLAQHFLASRRRDQSADVARDTVDRKISTVHYGSGDVLDNDDCVRVEYTLPVAVDARNVAVGSGALPPSSSSSAVHAASSR